MKKTAKKGVSLIVSALLLLSTGLLSSCGNVINSYDENKEQIFVYYYNGDNGNEWIDVAASDWNAENDKYEVVPVPSASEYYETQLVVNNGDAHAYIATHSYISSYINNGYLSDLSDILEKDVDGNGVKLKDKMNNYENYKTLYSTKSKNGFYAIPSGDSPQGLIFDYDLFVQQGWLCYQKNDDGSFVTENGKRVLTVGKDGKAGTYDDGQPTTIAEWEEMLDKIKKSGAKAFIYSTKYDFYIEPVLDALIAQYSGLDEYISLKHGRGYYTDANGQKVDVDLRHGYEMYKIPGVEKACKFLKDYLVNQDYVHADSWKSTGFTHRDAQQKFVSGYMPDITQAAFLVEAPYWENGNKTYFDQLVKSGDTDRGYGDREYRFMLLPKLGEDDKSYFSTLGSGCMFVSAPKSQSEKDVAIIEATKDFVAFTLKDKYLQLKTLGGVVSPFKYELTTEQKGQLTPFMKNTLEMLQDTEHIVVLGQQIYAKGNPVLAEEVEFASSYDYTTSIAGSTFSRPLSAFWRYSGEQVAQGLYDYRKNTYWASAVYKD